MTHQAHLCNKAKRYVNKLLVPLEQHYYHSYHHAIDVMERARYLGEKEGLSNKEIEMLGLAGLFHDTGFIIQYDHNEPIGAKIARNYLKSIMYPEDRIQIIERLILATDPNYREPKDILEKVIKDADMDNLGRYDFFEKNHSIKKELELIKQIKINDPDWIHGSVELMKEHQFETMTQQMERNGIKQENLEKMIDELWSKNK